MTSKCNGREVWPSGNHPAPWQQIVSFDPRPHHYNTLNLPTWDKADYPVLNQTRTNNNCDWIDKSSEHGYPCELNNFYVKYRKSTEQYIWHDWCHSDPRDFSYSHSANLYYAGNALHWDNNGRGAINLYWDSLSRHHNGFQIGRSLYPSAQSHSRKLRDPARWMDQVYGIQFEWDSGKAFGVSGHTNDTTNPDSDGYCLEDLVMTYVIMGSDGKVLKDCTLTLVKNKDLMPGICYWYEGYSFWNSDEYWRSDSVGQGKESSGVIRSGKCGFAIDCREPGFDMIRNCTWDGTKHGTCDEEKQVFLYSNNFNNAADPEGARGDAIVATRCIWTSMFVGIYSCGDKQKYRKNLRMWNIKPITVPVRYSTDNRHDPDDADSGRSYYPWQHNNCPVIHDPTYGGPSSAGTSEQILPSIMCGDDTPGMSYFKNGVMAKEKGQSVGSDDASIPLLHIGVEGQEEPWGYDRAGTLRGHLGIPPSGGTGAIET